jgi:hypothetical protein
VVVAEAVAMRPSIVRPGDVVIVAAFDDVPEHEFLVQEVYEDCVTGVALTGPLTGEYGEPEIKMILQVLGPQGTHQSQQVPIINKIRQKTREMGAVALRGKRFIPCLGGFSFALLD